MPEAKPSSLKNWARIALGACILNLAACGGPSSEEFVARAEQQLAAGHHVTAIIELKSALAAQSEEEMPRARWLLGKAYLDTGDMSSAEKELERARQLDWNPNDVLPALAKSLLTQGKFAAVVELPVAELEPRAKAQVKAMQALAQLGLGDPWEADALVAAALQLQPDDVDVRLASASLMGAMGDIAGALVVVEEVLTTAPNNHPAWSLKGELLRLQQQFPESLAAFDASIELFPDSFEDRTKRALINLQLQNVDGARVDADWLLRTSPQHPMSNYVQGLLHFQDGNYADSITALSLATSMDRQYPLVSLYLSAAQMMEGHRELALNPAERLVNVHPGFSPGRKLLATIYLQAGDVGDIENLLSPVLDSNPNDSQALNLMANALLLEGKTDQGLDLLARVQQLDPDAPAANFRLGAGLLLAGQDEAATRQLAQALALDPSYQQADILLVLRLLDVQDFDAAAEAAEAYRARNPASVTAHNLQGRVYLASEHTEEAVASFRHALTIEPGDPAANSALANIALLSGNVAAARKHFQAILEHREDYLPVLLKLALLEAREGNEPELVAKLNYALEAHPEALQPRLMLGRYYLWKNKAAKIPPLFSTLSQLQQQSPQVLHLQALAQLADQRHSDAVYTLEQLVQLSPDTALAYHLLGTAEAGAGDFDQAREEFRRALELDGDYPPTLVALARLAWADGNSPQFEQYLQRLIQLAPDAPNVLRLQAAQAARAGDSELAIQLATRVWTASPGTETTLELAGYQFMSGNSAEALRIVETWVAQQPGDVRARMSLASQLTHVGSAGQAIQQYEAVLELEPDNTGALNNLAWYLRTSQPIQARDYARRAVAIDPSAPQLLDTLAVLEHLNGDNQQAQRHIRRAVAASPGSPVLLYHQAQIESALGNKAAAIGILEKLLAGDSSAFNERNDAESLLVSLRE